jgi:hypothetical protein
LDALIFDCESVHPQKTWLDLRSMWVDFAKREITVHHPTFGPLGLSITVKLLLNLNLILILILILILKCRHLITHGSSESVSLIA